MSLSLALGMTVRAGAQAANESLGPADSHGKVKGTPLLAEMKELRSSLKPELVGQHPRVYFTAAELDTLRTKVHGPASGEWQADLAHLRVFAAEPPSPPAGKRRQQNDVAFAIAEGAFATQMEREPAMHAKILAATKRYMDAAVSYDVWGYGFSKPNVDLAAGHLLYGMGVGYDLLYNELTPAERDKYRASIARHGEFLYNYFAPKPGRAYSYSQNHTFIPMAGLAVAAYAVYGEVPEAAHWAALSRAIYSRVLATYSQDGYYYEGFEYWIFATPWIIHYLDVQKHATGEDLFDQPGLKLADLYAAHSLLPGGQSMFDFGKVVSMTHPYTGDPTEFPTGTNPYPSLSFSRGTGNASFLPLNQVVAFDPHYRWPYSFQINFGFQQQLGRSLSIGASYVGTLNRKLPLYNDINGPQFNINAAGVSGASCADTTKACGYANSSSTVNNRRPLNNMYGASAASPIYSQVYIIRSNQNSNYNSLQVTVEQRITHHVSARGYYTWSKTLQSNSLDSTGADSGVFLDANYPQLEARQRSDQDRREMMTMSFVWKPDYFDKANPVIRYALNGWTVTGIWTANSGQPFTVLTGNDNYFSGNGNNRPSIAPGKFAHVLDNGRSRVAMMNQWFDTSAYCISGTAACPGTGPLGLLGLERPASLDDPGYRNVDASLFRDFKIYREMRFQIRGEVTNVFNLTNLPAPTATMNSVNFGKITGFITDGNRIMQVGGRILF